MILFLFPSYSFATPHPRLISMIIGAFDSIQTWLVRIATPAVAVAVRFWTAYAKIQFW